MKTLQTLILSVGILTSTSVFSQTTPSNSASLSTELRLQEIDASIAEVNKSSTKSLKTIESNELNINDLERELQFNKDHQADVAIEKEEVLESMNGLVLVTLEDKISMEKKELNKANRNLTSNQKSINKKSAQIEKLQLEIAQMESENENLEESVAHHEVEIEETQNTITENNLVIKDEKYKKLEKEEKKLVKQNVKITQQLGKSKEAVARENRVLSQNQTTLDALKRQKVSVKSTGKGSLSNQ